MEFVLVALSAFFAFEVLKFASPWEIPGRLHPLIIAGIVTGFAFIPASYDKLLLILAASGAVSILSSHLGNARGPFRIKKTPEFRAPAGPWPPGSASVNRKPVGIPPL